jgi:hypothetical protein
MIKQYCDRECDLFSDFSRNKYDALNEVKSFLDSNGIIWDHLSQLLFRSTSACLDYSFGDTTIGFSRCGCCGSEKDDEYVIQLSIENQKDNVERKVTYEYNLRELAELRKRKQSTLDSFGE